MTPTRIISANAGQTTKSVLAYPVVVIIETTWNVRMPERRLAVLKPFLPELDGEEERTCPTRIVR